MSKRNNVHKIRKLEKYITLIPEKFMMFLYLITYRTSELLRKTYRLSNRFEYKIIFDFELRISIIIKRIT